jgi:hypothetical protein
MRTRHLLLSFCLIVLLGTGPCVVWLSGWAKESVESHLSTIIGQKVRITSFQLVISPSLGLRIKGVETAPSPQLGAITGKEILIGLEPGSIKGPLIRVKSVTISRVRISWRELCRLLERLSPDGGPEGPPLKPLQPFELKFKAISIVRGRDVYGPYDASVRLSGDGSVKKVTIRPRGDNAQVTFTFKGGALLVDYLHGNRVPSPLPRRFPRRLSLQAHMQKNGFRMERLQALMLGGMVKGSGSISWGKGISVKGRLKGEGLDARRFSRWLGLPSFTGKMEVDLHVKLTTRSKKALLNGLSVNGSLTCMGGQVAIAGVTKSPLKFDKLEVVGGFRPGRVTIEGFDALAYGGRLSGWLNASWSETRRLEGSVSGDSISIGHLLDDLGRQMLIGRLSGRWDFEAGLNSWGSLWGNLYVEGPFILKEGLIRTLDLSVAVDGASDGREKVKGTPFESLEGHIIWDGGLIRLKRVRLVSTTLEARGDLTIGKDRRLDGDAEVGIHKARALVGIPVRVSGTIERPVVIPAEEVIAGGVIGTAIAGPGLGTVLGLKAGHFIWKLKKAFTGGGPPEGRGGAENISDQSKWESSGF